MDAKFGGQYITATDWPSVTFFNPDTLETLGVEHPKQISLGQCAHWVAEPGTPNMLNYQASSPS